MERAVGESAPGADPVLLDLAAARGAVAGFLVTRHAFTWASVDLPAAFDALACLPTMSPSASILHDDDG